MKQQGNVLQMPAKPDATIEREIDYGYGPLHQISQAQHIKTTRSQVEAKAIAAYPQGDIGIWTKDGLVTQILRDESVIN